MKHLLVALFLMSINAHSVELFEVHTNARAMGMGGAFISIVDTEEALWYNPAGIANNGGVFWTLLDPKVGISDPDALTHFEELTDSSTFESALDKLYGEPIWAGASAKTSLMLPYFAAAYFYDLDASIIADNPVSPTLETNVIYDNGVAIGSGGTIGGILQMGFALKYINRTGTRTKWGAQTIADIVAGTSDPDIIIDSFTDTKGVGYSLDYGMNILIPALVKPTISFVWKNIGDTSFRADPGQPEPPKDESDMRIGASLLFDMPLLSIAPAIEVRQLDQGGEQIMKKVHMGIEIGLPLIDLRAGLYQGYYSAGVGLDLGLLQIDAATWGVELGGYPGQLESRRYMVQASLRLGFDFGFGSGGSRKGSGGSSGSGGSAMSGGGYGKGGAGSSYFKRRGQKLRR